MKWLLLALIKFYWLVYPESSRRKCLFKETCSNKIYRITKTSGLIAGLKTFYNRLQQCKPGYAVFKSPTTGKWYLKSISGDLYEQEEISENILKNAPR